MVKKLGNAQSNADEMPETKRSLLSLRPPSSSKTPATGGLLKNGDHPEQSLKEKSYDEAFFNPPKPKYAEVPKKTEEVKEKVERALRYNSKLDEDFAASFDDEATINENTGEFISKDQILNAPVSKRPTLRPVVEKQGVDDVAESLDEIRLSLAKTNYGKYANPKRLITNLQVFRDKEGKYQVNSSIQVVEGKKYRVGLINYSAGFLNERESLENADAAEMAVELGDSQIEFDYVKSTENNTVEVYKNSEEVLEDLINKVDKVDAGYMDRAAARLEGIDSGMTVGRGMIDLENKLLETIALGKKGYKVLVIREKQVLDATDLTNSRSHNDLYFQLNKGKIQLKADDIVLALPKVVLDGIATPYDQDANVSALDLKVEQLNRLVKMVEESKGGNNALDANLLKEKLEEKEVTKEGKTQEIKNKALSPNGSFSIMAIQLK
jgi:hypothetical protein